MRRADAELAGKVARRRGEQRVQSFACHQILRACLQCVRSMPHGCIEARLIPDSAACAGAVMMRSYWAAEVWCSASWQVDEARAALLRIRQSPLHQPLLGSGQLDRCWPHLYLARVRNVCGWAHGCACGRACTPCRIDARLAVRSGGGTPRLRQAWAWAAHKLCGELCFASLGARQPLQA